MDENDKRLAESKAQLKFLIDSSVYHEVTKLYEETGIDILQLLDDMSGVEYYYTMAMINEVARGRDGFNTQVVFRMSKHSLADEVAFIDEVIKEARFPYNHTDGTIKFMVLNSISTVDYGQITVAQNHKELVLLTNDHKMLKTGIALLRNGKRSRVMDLLNLLEMTSEQVPEPELRAKWQTLKDHYEKHSGFKRPKTARYIKDLLQDENSTNLD